MTQLKHEFKLDAQEYDAFTRLDFWIFVQRVFVELHGVPFVDNWHIQKLCAEIDRVRTEPNTRLAVAMPPRSLKSIIISIALPAWLLGHNPRLEIACVSYGQELAAALAAKTKRIMVAPWYRRLFPDTQLDRTAVEHLVTTMGGTRYATSITGTLTGMGADVMLVDDAMKGIDSASVAELDKVRSWASDTMFTRSNNKAYDRIVVTMQRLHEDDLIGHVMGLGTFELLSFPAIAQEDEVHVIRTPFGTYTHERKFDEVLHPEWESREVLDKQRTNMGSLRFAAQYLQSPTPLDGGIVKIGWFGRFDHAARPQFDIIFQSWDCASKVSELSDLSVCTTWGVTRNKDVYLLHVFRARLEYPELKRKVRELAELHVAGHVLIEDTASGIQLVQELKREGFARIVAVKPQGDKVMRMNAQTAKIEAGRVYIPKDAPWLDAYLHEIGMFPKGKHDDQVDSTSQALAWLAAPVAGQGFLDYYVSEMMGGTGLTPEQLSVRFDYAYGDISLNTCRGRAVERSTDGFYHVTPDEWECLRAVPGVRLIDGADY